MALSFDVAMNSRAAEKSAKDLGKSLKDIDKELDLVGKSRGLEEVEKDLEGVQKQSAKTEKALDKVGDGGFKKAGAASSEFKNEALQNFSEVTSSFDGSMQSVGDLAQGTLGGIASSIPGIGLLGGAAAVGIGLITSELVNQAEQAELLRERLSAAYLEAAQAGRGYIDAAQAVAEAQDLMFNPERAAEYKRIQEDSKTLMLDEGILIDANAGKTEAQAVVQERIGALLAEQIDKHGETDGIVGNIGQSVLGLKNRWDEVVSVTETEKQRVADLSEYSSGAYERERGQIQQTRDANQARWEAYASAADAATRERTQHVYMQVDDSAVRNYVPPIIWIEGRIQMPAGSRQLIQ